MTAFEELGSTTTRILAFCRCGTAVGTHANATICRLRLGGLVSNALPTTPEPVAAQGPGALSTYLAIEPPDETIRIQLEACMSTTVEPLPHLRFEIPEAARILRISRATLYERIREGLITTQKDGRRTFITAAELQRYVIPRS